MPFLYRVNPTRKYKISNTPKTDPNTIPTIAPADNPELFSSSVSTGVLGTVGSFDASSVFAASPKYLSKSTTFIVPSVFKASVPSSFTSLPVSVTKVA